MFLISDNENDGNDLVRIIEKSDARLDGVLEIIYY